VNATTVAEHEVLELETINRTADAPVPTVQQTGTLAEASPFDMMMSAHSRGASLEQIEKMMELQERWESRVAAKAYNRAFAAFKAEVVRIKKGRQVTDGPLKGRAYAELHDWTDAVTPVLSAQGLSASWKLTRDEPQWLEVTCTLKHVDGHFEVVSMGGPPDAGGAKNAMQARASTVSYLERYTLKAITGLAEGGDDDDGNGGNGNRRDGAPPTPPAPPAPRPTYPETQFRENLPKWREVIAAGRKTPDEIIAMAQTKHPLTDEQKRAIRKPAGAAAATGPTYAHVADQLNKAANDDALAVAADLIKDVADPAHRTELNALFDKRRAELNAA
jgi:hypothetical protein